MPLLCAYWVMTERASPLPVLTADGVMKAPTACQYKHAKRSALTGEGKLTRRRSDALKAEHRSGGELLNVETV